MKKQISKILVRKSFKLPEIFVSLALIISIISLSGLSACTPDTFMLNKYEERCWVRVRMLNGVGKAEKINENTFKINEDAIISLKVLETTQYLSEFDMLLVDGGEIDLYLYSTEFDFGEMPNMKISLSDKKYRIEKAGELLAESDTIKMQSGTFHRINLLQDAGMLRFKFDCDEVAIPEVNMKSTEYIIFRTVGNSKAIVRGLKNTENIIKFDFSSE